MKEYTSPTLSEKWVILRNRNYWWKMIYGVDVTKFDFSRDMDKLYREGDLEDSSGLTPLQGKFFAFHYEWYYATPTIEQFRRMAEYVLQVRQARA